MVKFTVIEKCAICHKRLGTYKDENGKEVWEMKVSIDSLLGDNFKSYNACGLCALDRCRQRSLKIKTNEIKITKKISK